MISRRRFIQGFIHSGMGLGAGAVLSSCQSLDLFFGQEKNRFDDEVVIIGGGLAGLTAAYALKKQGRGYRLFEASSRLGGRVWTLDNWAEAGSGFYAELGAEVFDQSHVHMLKLCQELSLNVTEVPAGGGADAQYFWWEGKWIPVRQVLPEVEGVVEALVRARLSAETKNRFDQMNAVQMIEELAPRASKKAKQYFAQICLTQFGVEAERQSAMHLFMSMDPEEGNLRTLRIEGGSGQLVRVLTERTRGVIPDFQIRLQSRITGIQENGEGFDLRFRTPQGSQTVWARNVIMALPARQITRIDGWKSLRLPAETKTAIEGWRLANHHRTLLDFDQRFWLEPKSEVAFAKGGLLGGEILQSAWDSSRGLQGNRGLISISTAGAAVATINAQTPQQIVQELSGNWKKFASSFKNIQRMKNWARHPFIEGSVSYFAPGEYLSRQQVFTIPASSSRGRLVFAGEHTSTKVGTMEGAVESGFRAASSV